MRLAWGLAAAALVLPTTAGCIVLDRPLTAKPPGCWYFGAAVTPGMYEAVGEAGNRSGVESASRGLGPSLPLRGLDLPLPGHHISLRRVERTAAFGDPHRRVLLGLEGAPGEGEARLTALVWKDNSPEQVADLARPFLENVTSAPPDQVDAWARSLAEARTETDRFPPLEGVAVERPQGAESDGYLHEVTIEPGLRLDALAADLSDRWERRASQARPYSLEWAWGLEEPDWAFRFGVATRVVATEVDGNRFILDVGATDEAFAYAAREPEAEREDGNRTARARAFVRSGFQALGLPAPEEGNFPGGGGRIC